MKKTWIAATILGTLATVACGSQSPVTPSAPPAPTTATLRISLDAACQYALPHILSANVWLDGVPIGVVAAGGTLTQTTSLGSHLVEATSYSLLTGLQLEHWTPYSVSVGINGGSDLLYCQ